MKASGWMVRRWFAGTVSTGLGLFVALLFLAPSASAVPACRKDQLLAFVPSYGEEEAHRLFAQPVIDYPHDAALPYPSGLPLAVRVDESGRVVCYQRRKVHGEVVTMTPQRRQALGALDGWRYTPFTQNARPVPALAQVHIFEQKLPEKHIPLPAVAPEKLRISLDRRGCYGSCPNYSVEIDGLGRVTYQGNAFVDVPGTHKYQVAPEKVAALVTKLRAKDIWSMRAGYPNNLLDGPVYVVTLRAGDEELSILDNDGVAEGMPYAVREIEREIDEVAQSKMWIRLNADALAHLQAERFAFRSQAGADLLANVVYRASPNGEAVRKLIELGAPLGGGSVPDPKLNNPQSLFIEALANRQLAVVEALIAKGVLKTGGKPDKKKIDNAFLQAIAGGSLAVVEKVWDAAGPAFRPSLTYTMKSSDPRGPDRQAPVTLFLENKYGGKAPWDGLAIAKWLAAKGCDIKASDGRRTLLNIAVEAEELEFVRYLLAQNVTLPAASHELLSSTWNEDLILLLLDAGADPATKGDYGIEFRRMAEYCEWYRVMAWIDQHGSFIQRLWPFRYWILSR